MDDVPALVEAFVSSGHIVPLGVHVAEVQALQQAATRLKVAAETCEHQLKQLAERAPLVPTIDPSQTAALQATRAELQAELEKSQHSSTMLVKQFTLKRDSGIERFMPLLLATVEKYDAQFERCAMLPGAEEALRRIGEQCSRCVPHITTTGRELRQPLPSALPHTDQATLMMLLSVALHAAPELNVLAEEAVAGLAGCEVLHSPKPVKGIHRCMQKVQEEYEGDYTRLLDLARVTIICNTIVELERILSWLLSGERAPRFEACRTKDRLSRSWDAELSGGNRDVMVNGWLSMGGHRKMIVEVQLHVRALFELKGDLHVLYAGARVLGAMEDLMVGFDGKLSSEVLERVRNGVLRKLGVACSPMDAAQIATLKEILHHEPCALLQLDLSNCTTMTDQRGAKPCFQGLTLRQLLLPPTEKLACWRLRSLKLARVGLVGELSTTVDVLLDCHMLQELCLGENALTGGLPDWLGRFPALRVLHLPANRLTGTIPESIGQLRALKHLVLCMNQLTGTVPEAMSQCKRLQHVELHGNQLTGTMPEDMYHSQHLSSCIFDDTVSWPPELLAAEAAKEQAAYEQQRAAGDGAVLLRLRGDPGRSLRHNFAERTARFVGFPSVGVPDMLAMSGILYFELELITALEGPQIGFVTERFRRTDRGINEGVGDDLHGWAVDGDRGQRWFGGAGSTWACEWAAGDVVGFAANIDAGKMAVAKNGSWTGHGCGVVFQDVDLKVGVYPAMAVAKGEVRYHLTAPFRHGPPRAEVWETKMRPIFEDATFKAVTGSALLAASDVGDVKAVKAALETGADTNATAERGVTALMLVARAGSGGAVQALLAKGADATLRSHEGHSALDLAAEADAVDCARLLIEKGGANVDAAGGARELTPLLQAAAGGHEAVVKVLLANGAQVDKTTKDGASVLML